MRKAMREDAMDRLDGVRRAWRAAHLVPLWESPLAHKPPPAPALPYKWSWTEVRPLIEMAFAVTSPAAIERRVLQLVNPQSRSAEDESTVRNLAAAIQCLLPGETARPHRHSMNALRFVLEGSGAETLVNGKICRMEWGDLILTPAWCWHEHRHLGSKPMVWLDVLDVPLHVYLGTGEFEPGPIRDLPETIDDRAFSVPNIQPLGLIGGEHSPVFRYPYADAAAAVAVAPVQPDGTRRVRYVNPVTGGAALALLDSFLIQIEPGNRSVPARSNASSVCLVVEGEGSSEIDGAVVEWRKNDIFTVPQATWVSHQATGGLARLFAVSDGEVLSRLGLLREELRPPSNVPPER
jgi:gentisate 1,2-dioxygenase